MAGGVGGDMLLDRDLGNMVDLVVDIVANLVDNRGSMSNNSRGSVGNSGNSGSSIGSNSWSSDSVTSSIDTSNEAMSVSGNTSYKAMSSNELSISISNWGSKATGNDSREDNKALHLVLC